MTSTVLDQRAPSGAQQLGRRRASRAQGTAEFALCAPIALIMLLGIVEAGFLMFGVGTSAYATGEAARVGAEAGNAANADMQVVKTLVDFGNPHSSPVLMKPAEEVTHGGGRVLSGRGDSCYLAIYNWLSNQVDPALGDTSPSCGQCTPVANTSTGCGFP